MLTAKGLKFTSQRKKGKAPTSDPVMITMRTDKCKWTCHGIQSATSISPKCSISHSQSDANIIIVWRMSRSLRNPLRSNPNNGPSKHPPDNDDLLWGEPTYRATMWG